jgi:hypothetical protein
MFFSKVYIQFQIRIQQNVPDPCGSGSTTLAQYNGQYNGILFMII